MRLPILILNPHPRCNCRCKMCDIWKTTDLKEFSVDDLVAQESALDQLEVEWVVLSGGEALMHRDLFGLCRILRKRSCRLTLLSSGILLERYADQITEWFDDVIVSLDGPPLIHDAIRGVPHISYKVQRAIGALRACKPGFPVTARCTVQRLNCGSLVETARFAQTLGLDNISFLAADLTSEAFNRTGGWTANQVSSVMPELSDLDVLAEQIEQLGQFGSFVVESMEKLRRILRHFRAHLQFELHVSPRCNAPWVSAVVESTGEVRPCFFHRPYGKIEPGRTLADVVNGPEAQAFRAQLDVASDETCRRCVCSLYRPGD
jgi:MoaA/NifB/PqqE/SkfB family radical SAM enzyme